MNGDKIEAPEDGIKIGDIRKFFVFRGSNDSLVGKMPNGMVVLFNRENPIFSDIVPGCTVEAKISYLAKNYVIADPLNPPEVGPEAIEEGLIQVSEMQGIEIPVIAAALLEILRSVRSIQQHKK